MTRYVNRTGPCLSDMEHFRAVRAGALILPALECETCDKDFSNETFIGLSVLLRRAHSCHPCTRQSVRGDLAIRKEQIYYAIVQEHESVSTAGEEKHSQQDI